MHSSDPAAVAASNKQQPPASSGARLLHDLGELIIKGRQLDPRVAKLKAVASTSTNEHVSYQEPEKSARALYLEKQLLFHIKALMTEQIPLSIEVLLAPDCSDCWPNISTLRDELPSTLLLLERWTLSVFINKNHETPAFITSQWLLNAIRSQIHFSQISAWLSKLQNLKKDAPLPSELNPKERQRKLSRETCNFKKLEANCDEKDLSDLIRVMLDTHKRSLNVVYAFKIPGETFRTSKFHQKPTNHVFPITDIGGNVYLKVVLESLPRSEEIPSVRCKCNSLVMRRRPSKDLGSHEELAVRMSSLTLGPPERNSKADKPFKSPEYKKISAKKLSMFCSPSGICPKSPTKNIVQANFALVDDRMHTPCSESGKHRCTCDDESDLSPKDLVKPGCSKGFPVDKRVKEMAKQRRRIRKEKELLNMRESGTSDSVSDSSDNHPATSIPILQASRFDRFRTFGYRVNRKEKPKVEMVSIATQTDLECNDCGTDLSLECVSCLGKTRRYDDLSDFCEEDEKSIKKHKCDNRNSFNFSIKRPKLRQYSCIYNKIESVMKDRRKANDIADLSLDKDDSVFDFENLESNDSNIPSTVEKDGFRLRLDSAASMVFHTKTGLPLTSSPAPIRKGKSCFDYDSTITNISGIKSALCHPDVSPLRGGSVTVPTKTRRLPRANTLLGSFEESVLKGRLEPVATVDGFTAQLGASGAFCPSHLRLPVTVFFYALGGTNAPYLGHINLGADGYHVPRSGTIQVSLLNPHGTLVKMFVVLYDFSDMPAGANTFLRQRTLHIATSGDEKPTLAYLIHLRFMTSDCGKLYLHTDIRIIVSKKADLDTGTALTSLNTTSDKNLCHVISDNNPFHANSDTFNVKNDCQSINEASNFTNDSGYHEDLSMKNDANSFDNDKTGVKNAANWLKQLETSFKNDKNCLNSSKKDENCINNTCSKCDASSFKIDSTSFNNDTYGATSLKVDANCFDDNSNHSFNDCYQREFSSVIKEAVTVRNDSLCDLTAVKKDIGRKEMQKKMVFRPIANYELRSHTIAPQNPKYSLR